MRARRAKRTAPRRHVLALCLAGMCAASCGPVVVVAHQDNTREAVDVWVDREYVGQLELGEELSEKVERGRHLIEARPRGEERTPWTSDGRGWSVFVDRGTILTLLPVIQPEDAAPGAPLEPDGEGESKDPLPIIAPREAGGAGAEASSSGVGHEERSGILGDNPY